MANLFRRQGLIAKTLNSYLAPGASLSVTILKPGAISSAVSSGTTATVYGGHGFSANDKFFVYTENAAPSALITVSSLTGTTQLNLNTSVSLVVGSILVNVGQDTGTATPNYDVTGLIIYKSDPDGSTATTNTTTVTTNSDGEYTYWFPSSATLPGKVWELTRTGSTCLDLQLDVQVNWDIKTTDQVPVTMRLHTPTSQYSINAIGTAGTNRLTITDDLNAADIFSIKDRKVGILTTAPGSDLSVAGSVLITGGLTSSATTTLTGGVTGGIACNAGTWPVNSATDGTDTTVANGAIFVGTIFIGANMTLTGIQYLIGSVGGTDKVIASLYSATGALLANSATAGVTVGTLATVQQVAFTATYAAVGPAYYWVGLTFNGGTAHIRTVPANCQVGNGVKGNQLSQTFGTPAAITPPTAFFANTVPVASIY